MPNDNEQVEKKGDSRKQKPVLVPTPWKADAECSWWSGYVLYLAYYIANNYVAHHVIGHNYIGQLSADLLAKTFYSINSSARGFALF